MWISDFIVRKHYGRLFIEKYFAARESRNACISRVCNPEKITWSVMSLRIICSVPEAGQRGRVLSGPKSRRREAPTRKL